MGQVFRWIVAFCLLGELAAVPLFDPFELSSPRKARGITGQQVVIPFVVYNNLFESMTITNNDGETIATDKLGVFDNYTDRFSFSFSDTDAKVWHLGIDPVAKSDEGIYSCIIERDYLGSATRKVELRVLESSEGLRWDTSLKCGDANILNGSKAECDPYGAYPCCSSGNWCGHTQFHCDCDGCKDYRWSYPVKPPTLPCPLTFYFIEGRCLKALPEAVGLNAALTKCEEIGAKLAIVEESDGIRDHIITFFDDPNADPASRGLFWIGYSPDAADLEANREELELWNWNGTDQGSTGATVGYVGTAIICGGAENNTSACDETFRRPICETPALT